MEIFSEKLLKLSDEALSECEAAFSNAEKIAEYNQLKMLDAFIKNGVTESMFAESTGYGYGDRGRETLDKVFACACGAEDAMVRHSLTCGTHTLTTALFGLLRPGDIMLCVSGRPYDTIQPVIGIAGGSNMGSLKDFGIEYRQVDLLPDGSPDLDGIKLALNNKVRMVYIQRSRGYSLRPSMSVETIGQIADVVKKNSNAVIMVDNCYGEWVQKEEPTAYGADIIAGSLIKNPGGAIAKTGGYIAGKKELVELCAYRATTPGLGREVGSTLGQTREMVMGLYNAPHVVGEAVKTAIFTSSLLKKLGFGVTPEPDEKRCDIIQAVKLENEKNLIAYCQGLQKGAPIDSNVVPEAWEMPGYDSKVIMSAGAFTLGSSIELSADAPLREPFAVWQQGGTNFYSGKYAVMCAVNNLLK
ncbi:MAG: methionine gamma-lyase family protein [Clostridia bacterium]|nr:methionine gamma-lyase family protein [Clostridia bacterium]